jgi:hypothetical protein
MSDRVQQLQEETAARDAGLAFEPRGEHVLRGLPEQWRIFAVVGG